MIQMKVGIGLLIFILSELLFLKISMRIFSYYIDANNRNWNKMTAYSN